MKINRQQVLDKYNNHCAYCGCEITLKTMQVDHKKSKRYGGTDEFKNLMPSCRLCNHYKRANNLETFRRYIVEMYEKLSKIYIFRVAEKYGMFVWKDWDGKFYFERLP
jgi:predicted restriction endonuclease